MQVVSVIKELSKLHAGSFGIEREAPTPMRPISKRPPRGHSYSGGMSGATPPKFGRGGGFRGGRGYVVKYIK